MFNLKFKKNDIIVYTILFIYFIFYLCNLDYSNKNAIVILSFFLIGLFSFYKIVFAKKNITLNRVFYIFIFFFFFLSPLCQYVDNAVIWSNVGLIITYSDSDYLNANLLLLLFLTIFEITYLVFHTKNKRKRLRIKKYPYLLMDTVSLISIIVLLVTGNITKSNSVVTSNSSINTQIINILKFIPISCLLISSLLCNKKTNSYKKSLLLYCIEILLIYFPFYGSTSRYLLFGAYLTVISLLFANSKYKSIYFLMFVVGFMFIFSAFNYFKYHNITDISGFKLGYVDFSSEDYDAYQLYMMTIKYVSIKGNQHGMNLLSALLCFIPRDMWTSKYLQTGEIVSEFFGSNFTNLSCPWFAELYFASGFVGIIFGGIFTGWLFKWIDSYSIKDCRLLGNCLFCIVSGFLIYILRGAILPTWSYTLSAILSLLLVYFILLIKNNFYLKKELLLS